MQHFGGRLLVFAVERDDWQTCLLIFAAIDLGTGIGSATETVLRRVDFSNINAQ